MKSYLNQAGFIINDEKSSWTPSHSLEWLGLTVNLLSSSIAIPEPKRKKIKLLVSATERNKFTTARLLPQLAGKIITCNLAVGPASLMFTKFMHMTICRASTWGHPFLVPHMVRSELKFWHSKFINTCAFPFFGEEVITTENMFTDASASWGGGYIVGKRDAVVQFTWADDEAAQSSMHRELRACLESIKTLHESILRSTVTWCCDNQNAVRVKESLHVILLDIFHFCASNNITLSAVWVRHDENKLADYLSKYFKSDGWSVSTKIFNFYNNMWGQIYLRQVCRYF